MLPAKPKSLIVLKMDVVLHWRNFNAEKTIRLTMMVSQNVVHEHISLHIIVKVHK
jgi:hypothetical protein